MSLNTKKPMRLYDDRGKVKEYATVNRILFEDGRICVATASIADQRLRESEITPTSFYVMIDKTTGAVKGSLELTDWWGELDSWYAENLEIEHR